MKARRDSILPLLLLALALAGRAAPLLAAGDGEPATKAAGKIVETIALVESALTATRYQHATVVNVKKGIFYWDCSGMTAWVLDRAAPKARLKLPGKHPLARDVYKVIDKSPAGQPKGGWLRLTQPGEIRPGDLFAWLKPDFWKNHKNTGHVGFVVEAPRPHPTHANVWLVRVADASRYLHEGDSRSDDGVGGFGTGTMAFQFDESGTPLAYGWYGTPQDPQTYVPTKIVFGRVTK
jgi:hypothetical protein